MQLGWILWIASALPAPLADPLCLAATVYLEARNQSELGQRAVAEVVLRRLEQGRYGDDVCAVVLAPGQFATGRLAPTVRLEEPRAWERATRIAFAALEEWRLGPGRRRYVVPRADHFHVDDGIERPWAQGEPVAVIGDHAFYHVLR
ncbi:MAG: cell wall hydrolase [Xanthomonadales bacterium]|nr:cell wall hydrolase [Xanthomonadales bacterium]